HLVVVGSGTGPAPGFQKGVYVTRYSANLQSPTTSFVGFTSDTFGAVSVGEALLLGGDKVLVAGTVSLHGDPPQTLLLRYNADGTLDTSFNNTGWVTNDLGLGTEYLTTAALQADGKIVIGGENGTVEPAPAFLARYNADGSLDDGGPLDSTPGDHFGTN